MAQWIELTEIVKGQRELPIHVNLEQVSSIQRSSDGKFTTVWFIAGPREGRIKVRETPADIFRQAAGETAAKGQRRRVAAKSA